MSVNKFVPGLDRGARFDQDGAIFGVTLAPGGNCAICGNAAYCGGVQCPNAPPTLPFGPDGVSMVDETYIYLSLAPIVNFIPPPPGPPPTTPDTWDSAIWDQSTFE